MVVASQQADSREVVSSEAVRLWSRAAALGSLWAAFEIVVGSALHNLRVPFAGTLMATASVFLLTAAAQVWEVRGLLWRAALVCALMKSMSPSAVLLGPMIGIFAEGVILQVTLRLLGRGWGGCAVGGALAVSYTLLHKIVALTIVYGADLVRVFTGIVQFASKVTGWQGLQPANVLLGLVAVQSAMGIVAGVAGWYVGRQVRERGVRGIQEEQPDKAAPVRPRQGEVAFRHALPLLALWLFLLPGGLWLFGAVSPALSVPALVAVVAGVMWRYRPVARRFVHPRLWAEMLLVVVLSGLALGAAKGDVAGGLWAGLRMAQRAVWVVALFGAIGVELTHPRLLRWLSRGRFAIVQAAVQSAFRALPTFLASIPNLKEVVRRPVATLSRLFHLVDQWQRHLGARQLVILTGERGEGKTTLCLALAEQARRAGWRVGGIASPGDWRDGQREGYHVRDLMSQEERPLAQRGAQEGAIPLGAFWFHREGIAFGRGALEAALTHQVQLLIVDEVGPLELRGDGWAPLLDRLHTEGAVVMVWVVRPELVQEVRKRYPLFASAILVRARETDGESLAQRLLVREMTPSVPLP